MKCLTRSECSEWLKQNNLVESPYGKRREGWYMQFEPPRNPRKLTAFIRWLLETLEPFKGALMVVEDCGFDHPDEIALINAVRRGHDERRPPFDAPGHLFEATEKDLAVALSYLTLVFDWSAYLYLQPPASATMLFWEGDLIDAWSENEKASFEIREAVKNFELRVTCPKSDAAI